jgi:hypothetical protein
MQQQCIQHHRPPAVSFAKVDRAKRDFKKTVRELNNAGRKKA